MDERQQGGLCGVADEGMGDAKVVYGRNRGDGNAPIVCLLKRICTHREQPPLHLCGWGQRRDMAPKLRGLTEVSDASLHARAHLPPLCSRSCRHS